MKMRALKFSIGLLSACGLISCAAVQPLPNVEPVRENVSESSKEISPSAKTEPAEKSDEKKSAEKSLAEKSGVENSDKVLSPEISPEPFTETKDSVVETSPDIYVEIPRLAEEALARADSFWTAGNRDSALSIAEKFSVLKPLWETWQERAQTIRENILQADAQKNADLRKLRIELANANARRADFAEIRTIADSILNVAADDTLRFSVDSLKKAAYVRTFEKVRGKRDEILKFVRERAAFDSAEIRMTDLLMRYSDFADTLKLKEALIEIGAMRSEESMLPDGYWKSHDPNEALAKAQKFRAEKKWSEAKKILVSLKSSALRGEASRAIDSLDAEFCTEKRKLAASDFGKSRKSDREKWLRSAIGELNRCLEFAPGYRERATVLSNRKFLESELEK